MENDMRDRAWRRAQDKRAFWKQYRNDKASWLGDSTPNDWSNAGSTWEEIFEERYKRARLLQDHRKSCSCFMCGNPRHFWSKPRTLQELKNEDSFKQQMKEKDE